MPFGGESRCKILRSQPELCAPMNGPFPSKEAEDGASFSLATIEESWAHEQVPSEPRSGEQRQKVLGVSAGLCPRGGKGKAGVDAPACSGGPASGAAAGYARLPLVTREWWTVQTLSPSLPLLFLLLLATLHAFVGEMNFSCPRFQHLHTSLPCYPAPDIADAQ